MASFRGRGARRRHKRRDLEYRSGDRTGMQKIKFLRTADCVVGGFRYAAKARVVGSLLLGLYNDGDRLDHVGFCSSLRADQRRELTPKLVALRKPPGFTGKAPGGPSRWSSERSGEWKPLVPRLVVEVQYDHFSQGRFRHGTKFLRWRPDKSPKECTMAQANGRAASRRSRCSSRRRRQAGFSASGRRSLAGPCRAWRPWARILLNDERGR